MKILILTQGVKNKVAMNEGLALARTYAASIGLNYEYTFKETLKQFHSYSFSNEAVGPGVYVQPQDILSEVDGDYKQVIFIYDSSGITPYPTNPAQHTISLIGCNPIQIPEQWYSDYSRSPSLEFPTVLADYILHEQSHDGHGRKNDGTHDLTHLLNNRDWDPVLYDLWSQKQPHEYYLFLLKQYIPTTTTLRFRSPLKDLVQQMQKSLGGLVVDGSFGPKTLEVLTNFQKSRGLVADGICGIKTWSELKKNLTLLDVIIKVESNGNDFVEGDLTLTNHAYGCLQIRQGVCDDINQKFGTTYKARDCLGNRALSIEIWNKYWLVYPEKITDEDKSKTWNGGPGWKQFYGKPGKEAYTKNLDIYWGKVKSLLK